MLVQLVLNGKDVKLEVSGREILADTLREQCALTAVHLGCEHGSCGACTVDLDGSPARSCLVLTASCEGRAVTTLEGLAKESLMQIIKSCFHHAHALQCGFCTPGMLITARDIVLRHEALEEAHVRHALAGQICRCTGYVGIVSAIIRAHGEYHSLVQA